MGLFTEDEQLTEDLFMFSGNKIGLLQSRRGVTLFELLVAMVILVMVTAMLYSVLNVGIKFSDKGEDRIGIIEQERSLLDLLRKQVHGARYDRRQKKLTIVGDGESLKLITSSPLIEHQAELVLAIYRYDRQDKVLYYTEKVDFYNTEYDEGYEPDLREMSVLISDLEDIGLEYDKSEGLVRVSYSGLEHEMVPRCWQSGDN
jgi:prepilin-type N-terminal cleavage/methylation domain-containing protein